MLRVRRHWRAANLHSVWINFRGAGQSNKAIEPDPEILFGFRFSETTRLGIFSNLPVAIFSSLVVVYLNS